MTRRGSLSIRTKLGAAFGALVLLMAAIGGVAVAKLSTENAHVNELASRVVPATDLVGQASAAMNKYRKDQLHYILATLADRAGAQGVSGDLAGDLQTMAQLLSDYRAKGLISEVTDATLLRRFQAAFYTYVSASSAFRRLADANQIAAAGAAVGSGAGDNAFNALKDATADGWPTSQRSPRRPPAPHTRPTAPPACSSCFCSSSVWRLAPDRRAHTSRDGHERAQARPCGRGDLPEAWIRRSMRPAATSSASWHVSSRR